MDQEAKKTGNIRVNLSVHVPFRVHAAIFALRIYAFFGGRFDPERVGACLARRILVVVK